MIIDDLLEQGKKAVNLAHPLLFGRGNGEIIKARRSKKSALEELIQYYDGNPIVCNQMTTYFVKTSRDPLEMERYLKFSQGSSFNFNGVVLGNISDVFLREEHSPTPESLLYFSKPEVIDFLDDIIDRRTQQEVIKAMYKVVLVEPKAKVLEVFKRSLNGKKGEEFRTDVIQLASKINHQNKEQLRQFANKITPPDYQQLWRSKLIGLAGISSYASSYLNQRCQKNGWNNGDKNCKRSVFELPNDVSFRTELDFYKDCNRATEIIVDHHFGRIIGDDIIKQSKIREHLLSPSTKGIYSKLSVVDDAPSTFVTLIEKMVDTDFNYTNNIFNIMDLHFDSGVGKEEVIYNYIRLFCNHIFNLPDYKKRTEEELDEADSRTLFLGYFSMSANCPPWQANAICSCAEEIGKNGGGVHLREYLHFSEDRECRKYLARKVSEKEFNLKPLIDCFVAGDYSRAEEIIRS
jgi:hypothetical protein